MATPTSAPTAALLTDPVSQDAQLAVRSALLWGFEAVVLREVGGERVPTVNEGRLRKQLGASEMDVAAIAPSLFEGSSRATWLSDAEALAETLGFAARFGCSLVLVGAADGDPAGEAVEVLRRAAEEADAHGCRLGVWSDVHDDASVAALVHAVAHPALGAVVAPDAAAAAEPERLAGVWVGPKAVAAAEEALTALAVSGWAGPVVLAYEDRPDRTAALHLSADLIGIVRRARRAARASGHGG